MKKRGQGITKVSDLFKKYRDTLIAPQGSVIDAFIEATRVHVGVVIQKNDCSYSPATRTLTYRGSGMIKTEILLKKEMILKTLSERLGKKSVPEKIL